MDDNELKEARERASEQVLTANTLPKIETAKQVLREWIKAYPEEQGMQAGFEKLYTIQEIIEENEAEPTHPSHLPIGAGQAA